MRFHLWLMICCVLTLTLNVSSAVAQSPLAVETKFGPPRHTYASEDYKRFERDVVDVFLASRQLGDWAYRETQTPHGVTKNGIGIKNWHDPKWDDAAEKFLRNWGGTLCQVPNARTPLDLLDEGWPIVEAGCDEPMILYALAWTAEKLGKQTTPRDYMRRIVSILDFTGYPASWKSAICNRYAMNLDRAGLTKEAGPFHTRAATYLVEAIQAGEFQGKLEQRKLVPKLCDRTCTRAVPAETAETLLKQVKELDGVDDCTYHTVKGLFHIRRAWDFRGSGFAKTVTDEGWAGFEKHLKIAQHNLLKAYEADPTRPEAAAAMLTVCKGYEPPQGTTAMDWFNRSIAAEIDYMLAYDNLLDMLQPRWCGSHEEALRLGLACAASNQFDTDVPIVFINAVSQIYSDNLDPAREILDSQEIYDLLIDVTRKLEANANHQHRRDWLESVRAAAALQSGRFADAKKFAAQLGDNADTTGLRLFGASVSDIQRIAGQGSSPTKAASAIER